MKVVGKNAQGLPIKRITLDVGKMELDPRYPFIDWIEHNGTMEVVFTGTEDQFKSLYALIHREVESDRDDPATIFYREQQKSDISS